MAQNYNDFILTRSPYYVTYSATASLFDYATLDLWVWQGDKTTPPATASFNFTAYKAKTSDNTIYFQINDYINGFLDPQINDLSFFTGNTASFIPNEAAWVKWVLKSYKLSSGIGALYQTATQSGKPATLGYGYHSEGANPTPTSNTLIQQSYRFGDNDYYHYNTSINTTTNLSSQLISRTSSNTGYKLCREPFTFYQIIFLNKSGVFDTMDFTRISHRSLNITSDKYDSYNSRPYSYSPYTRTDTVFNVNASEEYVLNTDLLDDYNNEVIEQLHLSDRWWLYDGDKNLVYPATLLEKGFPEKIGVNEMAKIQWTLKFELANNKINDIR